MYSDGRGHKRKKNSNQKNVLKNTIKITRKKQKSIAEHRRKLREKCRKNQSMT
jgi:hypothetical protein